MRIIEVTERTPELIRALTGVWEASVRQTHLFLSDDEVLRIRAYVPEALASTAHLFIAEEVPGAPMAFMGVDDGQLSMLFISPGARGSGLGRRLVSLAINEYSVDRVAVNEQNPGAVGFYEHMGFKTFNRTDTDEQGGPYPLLYMRL